MIRRIQYLGCVVASDLIWLISDLLSFLQAHLLALRLGEYALALYWVGYWRFKRGHRGKPRFRDDFDNAVQCGFGKIWGEASGKEKNSDA